MKRINVIDLFAGPGGLGEGFSAYYPNLLGKRGDQRVFDVRFSIEMDKHAHRTLFIRSFLRQFSDGYPPQYYDFYRGKISFDEFRAAPELQDAWRSASVEVGHRPLKMGNGQDDKIIQERISSLMAKTADGEPWVVIGGPPCQAFSSVGRVRNMAKPDYRQSNDDRIYAYVEYLKILDQVLPDCFVLENVEGMLHTAPDGERIFPTIFRQLRNPSTALTELGKKPRRVQSKKNQQSYKIVSTTAGEVSDLANGHDFLVPIARYGVPQDRRRVILIGIRTDTVERMATTLPQLSKFSDKSGRVKDVTVGETISDLPRIRSKISFRNFFGEKTKKSGRRLSQVDCYLNGFLSRTAEKNGQLKPSSASSLKGPLEVPRTSRIGRAAKAERLIGEKYPDYRDTLRRIRKARMIPNESKSLWLDLMSEAASLVVAWGNAKFSPERLLREAKKLDTGTGDFVRTTRKFGGPAHLKEWLLDSNLDGVSNHESREHKGSDLLRYLYFATHVETRSKSASNPNMQNIPKLLKPDHANVDSGHFSDRFRVQWKDEPAKTITCHLSKDGHAFIHFDPAQCRALTVREAARLQTFPDNYLFAGPVSEQRKQVGNAVPPWFAVQLAGLVHELIFPEPTEDASK